MTEGRIELGKRVTKESESPYLQAYRSLVTDLRILLELNKQLPKSIKERKEKGLKSFSEKIDKLDKKSRAEFHKSIDKVMEFFKEKRSLTIEGKPAELLAEFVELLFLPERFNMFIRDMSLVYLIAQFESFLQNILRISFLEKPESLMSCQKSMTFEELMKFKDIDSVKQQIIQKEILSRINQDIEDINKYFGQKFNTDLSQFVNWKEFKERFYRRNILIHNSGMTNKLYRLKTGYKGKTKRMTVSQGYLKDSIELFEKMALKISEHFDSKFKV